MYNSNYLLASTIAALAAGMFAIDLVTPPVVGVWIAYVGVVLLSLWLPRPRDVYVTATLCAFLILLGLFTDEGDLFWLAALNRILGVVALWVAAVVGLAARRTLELQEANQRLQQEMVEREKLQAQLLRSQRLESMGTLASGIAHDFNNLLTPILMATKLLKTDRSEDDRESLLETLQASAERGADVVRQLMAFTGNGEFERAVVQLEQLVKEVKTILDIALPKSIQIEIELQRDLRSVHADATQLIQVFLNLCVNARDAMPNGGKLTISARNIDVDETVAKSRPDAQIGPYVVVSVSDTGFGIATDVLDKVFDPFFTTKVLGEGTGLGLSTALGIIRGHQGFIDVTSEVGRGSRFDVFLPSQPMNQECEPVRRPTEITPGRGELILMVDDEALILEMAKTTLEGNGYQVRTAKDGEGAIACFQKEHDEIQVVVLDMMMPGMDGETAFKGLRALAPRVRIIPSSGLRPRGNLAEAISAHEMDFLQKPYSDRQLLDVVAMNLRMTSESRE